jgi:hypothetical protein
MTKVYFVPNDGDQPQTFLEHFDETQVLSLMIPEDLGAYLVLGKVVLNNGNPDWQPGSAWLTTLDGHTTLDRADVLLEPCTDDLDGSMEVSLQGTMQLPHNTFNNVVDLRCSTWIGHAAQPQLCVVSLDSRAFAPVH